METETSKKKKKKIKKKKKKKPKKKKKKKKKKMRLTTIRSRRILKSSIITLSSSWPTTMTSYIFATSRKSEQLDSGNYRVYIANKSC